MPKRTRDHRSVLIEDLRNNPLLAANYLTAALEDSDKMFLRALRDVAEANRIAKVAEEAGLSRETLYRTLSEEGNPRLSSLSSIFRVLGLRIKLHRPNEIAAAHQVDISTAWRWIREGRIHAIRDGRLWRITHREYIRTLRRGIRPRPT